MGHLGNPGHPDVQAKLDDSIKRIVAAGRTAGTMALDGNVAHYAGLGVRFFFTGVGPWIAAGARDYVAKAMAGME